jgi:hypothetical protein
MLRKSKEKSRELCIIKNKIYNLLIFRVEGDSKGV